jgi:tetratricopeptide (TPR) repeat protein
MAKGLIQEAREELARGLRLALGDMDLQLANARVLLALGQADQALAALDKMDASADQPWKIDSVRGRALVALKQWSQAAAVLKRAIVLNPDPAEAHYALGLLHQHQGEWEQAARAYRDAFESTAVGRTIKTPEPASGGQPIPPTPAK